MVVLERVERRYLAVQAWFPSTEWASFIDARYNSLADDPLLSQV